MVGSALAIGVVGAGGFRLDPMGVLAALLAAVSFAFYNIAGHHILTRYDRWIVLLYTTFSAAAFWIFVNPPWKLAAAHYSAEQLAFLLVFRCGLGAGAVLALLRRTATPGADTCDCGELPGAGVLDRAGGVLLGRSPAPGANAGNRHGAGSNRDRAAAGRRRAGGGM